MAIATTAERNSLASRYGTDAAFGLLFTADPGTSGTISSEVSGGSPAYARKALTWGAASNGLITATATFDVPAGATVTFVGVGTALSGGTLLDRVAVTSQAFSAQGTYQVSFSFQQS